MACKFVIRLGSLNVRSNVKMTEHEINLVPVENFVTRSCDIIFVPEKIKCLPCYFPYEVAVEITPILVGAQRNSWVLVSTLYIPTIRHTALQALGVPTLGISPATIVCSSERHRICNLQAVRSPIQLCTFHGVVACPEGPAFRGLNWQQEPRETYSPAGTRMPKIANPGLVFRNLFVWFHVAQKICSSLLYHHHHSSSLFLLFSTMHFSFSFTFLFF